METLSPYEILQVDEDADYYEVKHRYHFLAKMLHPDKKNIKSGNTYIDSLTVEERSEILQQVREAYRTIRKIMKREEVSLEMEYDPNDLTVPLNHNLKNGFSSSALNARFDEISSKLREHDPYDQGYAEFNRKNGELRADTIPVMSQEEKRNYLKKKKSQENNRKKDLVVYKDPFFSGVYEMGLDKIQDFSCEYFSAGKKSKTVASDLMAAHENGPLVESISPEHFEGKIRPEKLKKKLKKAARDRKKHDENIIYETREERNAKLREANREYEKRRKTQMRRDADKRRALLL